MNYNLHTPCAQCPFRNDIKPFVRPERIEEILTSEGTFPCHKTVDYSDDDGGHDTPKSQHCAGFLIVLEKEERPNQAMRIAERLGLYDHTKLRMDAPVYESIEDAIEAHERNCARSVSRVTK